MPAKMEFFMGFAIEEGYEALIAKKPEGMNEGITSNPSGSWVEGWWSFKNGRLVSRKLYLLCRKCIIFSKNILVFKICVEYLLSSINSNYTFTWQHNNVSKVMVLVTYVSMAAFVWLGSKETICFTAKMGVTLFFLFLSFFGSVESDDQLADRNKYPCLREFHVCLQSSRLIFQKMV